MVLSSIHEIYMISQVILIPISVWVICKGIEHTMTFFRLRKEYNKKEEEDNGDKEEDNRDDEEEDYDTDDEEDYDSDDEDDAGKMTSYHFVPFERLYPNKSTDGTYELTLDMYFDFVHRCITMDPYYHEYRK